VFLPTVMGLSVPQGAIRQAACLLSALKRTDLFSGWRVAELQTAALLTTDAFSAPLEAQSKAEHDFAGPAVTSRSPSEMI
jgi:hypothetical protein